MKFVCIFVLLTFNAAAMAAEPTAAANETVTVNAPIGHFFYKLGPRNSTVQVVYVSAEFMQMYFWEKEAMIEPLFISEHKKYPALTTLALRDAISGKTVGTYTPKAGISML